MLPAGTQIDRYRVEMTIGSGSMGDVMRGMDVDLRRPVALKILSDRHRQNEELRARFMREGRAVAAISHPNVVQVFTIGSFDGRPYIAMELLRGVDLGSIVKEQGPMNSAQAAKIIFEAAQGLRAAALAGLIHRDVKPSNLVLLDQGMVKVTDFGLAKPIDPGAEPALTALGVVVGTPDYIAPEQARGDVITERVDIYALGGTLYYLLTGVPPFRTGIPAEDKYLKVVARHLKDPPPDPRKRVPRIDDELANLCQRLMAKAPADRPTYDQLLTSLFAITQRLPTSTSGSRMGTVQPTPDRTPLLGGNTAPRARSSSAPSPHSSPTPDLRVSDIDNKGTLQHSQSVQPFARGSAPPPGSMPQGSVPASSDSDSLLPLVTESSSKTFVVVVALALAVVGLGLFFALH